MLKALIKSLENKHLTPWEPKSVSNPEMSNLGHLWMETNHLTHPIFFLYFLIPESRVEFIQSIKLLF